MIAIGTLKTANKQATSNMARIKINGRATVERLTPPRFLLKACRREEKNIRAKQNISGDERDEDRDEPS